MLYARLNTIDHTTVWQQAICPSNNTGHTTVWQQAICPSNNTGHTTVWQKATCPSNNTGHTNQWQQATCLSNNTGHTNRWQQATRFTQVTKREKNVKNYFPEIKVTLSNYLKHFKLAQISCTKYSRTSSMKMPQILEFSQRCS